MHHHLGIAGVWLGFLGIYIMGENPRWHCLLRLPYHLCTLAAPIFLHIFSADAEKNCCDKFGFSKVWWSLQFTRCRGVRFRMTRLNFTSLPACSVLHSCPWPRKSSRSLFGAALSLVLCLDLHGGQQICPEHTRMEAEQSDLWDFVQVFRTHSVQDTSFFTRWNGCAIW